MMKDTALMKTLDLEFGSRFNHIPSIWKFNGN